MKKDKTISMRHSIFSLMIGESVEIAEADHTESAVRCTASNFKRSHNMTYTVNRIEGGVRVTRTS